MILKGKVKYMTDSPSRDDAWGKSRIIPKFIYYPLFNILTVLSCIVVIALDHSTRTRNKTTCAYLVPNEICSRLFLCFDHISMNKEAGNS